MAKFWDRLEQTLVGLLGLCAMGVGMWQILGRYFDSSLSSGWGDEVIIYLLIWSIMIVSSQLVRQDGHVRPDLVLRVLPPQGQRWMEVLNCLAAILFLGGMVWYGWQIVETGWMLDERSPTELSFPMYLYYLALPVGSALMVVRTDLPRITPAKPISRINRATVQRATGTPSLIICRQTLRTP